MKRTPLALVTAGALGLLLAVAPVATAARTADAPWSGFALPTGSNAGGGWIGARAVGGEVVYRIDPSRTKQSSTGFAAGTWQERTTGTGPRSVSTTDTARAAWILSKYGSYRYDVQNAAVEVALDELLHGGRFARDGAATRQRLARTPQASKIRAFAGTMLTDSARFAGPYAVAVTPVVGTGNVTVTVRVTATRTGAGVANLPVQVRYGSRTVTGLATGSAGTVTTTFPAGAAGVRQVTAVVDKLPEARLLVRAPSTPGASRVVVAGRKVSRTTTAPVVVRAAPRVTTISTTPTVLLPRTPAGQLTVSGSAPGPRTATLGLYGPYPTATAASCEPKRLAASGTVAVTGDGTYPLPTLSAAGAGYYRWGAWLPADTVNAAAASCAGDVLVRVSPSLAATPTGTQYRTGAYIRGQVRVAGVPAGLATTATLRLYGPFVSSSSTSCSAARLKATQQVQVTGAGTFSGPEVKVTGLGYYLWAADLPETTFSTARTTSCAETGAVFQVTW